VPGCVSRMSRCLLVYIGFCIALTHATMVSFSPVGASVV
jgi:hypothetical protein